MKIQAFTDTGKVRDMNQDAFKTGFFKDGGAWAVVCDGMGGVSGGQVASEICINEVSSHIEKGYRKIMSMKSVKNLLVSAVTAANIKVFETQNCIIHTTEEKKVVVQGLDGYIVAEKGDTLLICKLSEEQRIKEFSE